MSDGNGKLDKIEHPKKAAFLAAFEETGIVSAASSASGVSRSDHYWWLKNDPEYRVAVKHAKAIAVESMEREARRRAIEGWDEPVFYEGSECGYKRKYSDTLLIFLLKGEKPQKYRERTDHHHSGTVQQDIHVYIPDNRRQRLIESDGSSNGNA